LHWLSLKIRIGGDCRCRQKPHRLQRLQLQAAGRMRDGTSKTACRGCQAAFDKRRERSGLAPGSARVRRAPRAPVRTAQQLIKHSLKLYTKLQSCVQRPLIVERFVDDVHNIFKDTRNTRNSRNGLPAGMAISIKPCCRQALNWRATAVREPYPAGSHAARGCRPQCRLPALRRQGGVADCRVRHAARASGDAVLYARQMLCAAGMGYFGFAQAEPDLFRTAFSVPADLQACTRRQVRPGAAIRA